MRACEHCDLPAVVDACPSDPWPLCQEHLDELTRRISEAQTEPTFPLEDVLDELLGGGRGELC